MHLVYIYSKDYLLCKSVTLAKQFFVLDKYVYDFSEILFKVDNFIGSRKDLQTLCPGRIIESDVILKCNQYLGGNYAALLMFLHGKQIVHMMALKFTYNQKHSSTKAAWSLPPLICSISLFVDSYQAVMD